MDIFTIAQPVFRRRGGVCPVVFVRKTFAGDYRTAENELSEHLRIYYNTLGIAACYQQRSWWAVLSAAD